MRVPGKLLFGLLMGILISGRAGELNNHFTVVKAFKGSSTYSKKEKFSITIPTMYVAHDAAGKPVMGAAMRAYKTYKKVTSLLVIEMKDEAYVVSMADVPDIHLIKGEDKREIVLEGMRSVIGRTVKDKQGKSIKVDAVSGATRYTQRAYANYDLMARKIVEQMEANPDWERIPIQKD